MLLFSHPEKPLMEHLNAVATAAEQAVATVPWTDAALGITLQEVAHLIGLYHDVGKGTTYFQTYLTWNVAKDRGEQAAAPRFDDQLKSHALLSAVAAYVALKQYLAQASWGTEEQRALLAAIGFYVVRQHHQDLDDNLIAELSVDDRHNLLHKQIAALVVEYFANLPYWKDVYRVLSDPSLLWIDTEIAPLIDGRDSIFDWNPERFRDAPDLRFYIISLVLFSSLLDGDKLDASRTSLPQRASVSISSLDAFRRWEFGQNSAGQNDMNALREWAYRTVVLGANNTNDHICSLSLPTGSGKTLAALGWALSLRDHLQQRSSAPRIIYALPFISIVDQNYDVFKRALTVDGQPPPSNILLAHTHLSGTQYDADNHTDENICLEPALTANQQELLVEGWESEVIVTTFVQLFETFFSGRNRMTRRFLNIAGSIVILDEVQAFPHKYWLLFQKFAQTMADLTGTYFLLCTATQPAIFDVPHELAPNIPSHARMTKPRTELVWTADQPLSVDEFVELVIQNHHRDPGRYLLVLNTIGSAEQVCRKLVEEVGETTPVTFLSTYLCPVDRLARIRDLRDGGNASGYVVSTQLIEAGVDIDAHAAYRDMAPLDSIIQVAGRVNRGGERSTEQITIVQLQNEKGTPFSRFIYDPLLRDKTEHVFADIHAPVPETAYAALSHNYYEALQASKSDDESRQTLASLSALDFSALQNFTLIDNDRPRISVFVELNDGATAVLEAYYSSRTSKDLWERRARWNSIKSDFLKFVVNVPVEIFKETGLPALEGSDSFFLLPLDQLDAFYDPVTGFNQGDTSARIW